MEALTVTEACRCIGIGKSKLYEMIKAGRIKAKKIGSKTLILRKDVDAFLTSLPDMM